MKFTADFKAIWWALVRRYFYLLFKGMWRGECGFTAWGVDNRIWLVAAATGSVLNDTLKVTRVFYVEESVKDKF